MAKKYKMEILVIHMDSDGVIRLPETLLRRYKIGDTVELTLEKNYIILKPKAKTRFGWEEAFRSMNAAGDDALLMDDFFEDEL